MNKSLGGALCAGLFSLGLAASVKAVPLTVPVYNSGITASVCEGSDCTVLQTASSTNFPGISSFSEFSNETITELRDLGEPGVFSDPTSTTFTYSGAARSSESGLQAMVSSSVFNETIIPEPSDVLGGNATYETTAFASMRDTLSITGASDLASIQFDIDIHGTRDIDGFLSFIQVTGSGASWGTTFGDFAVSDFDLTIQSGILAVNGGFVDIGLNLLVNSSIEAVLATFPGLNGSTFTVDFFNTITIDQVRGFNASGQLVDLSSATGSGGQVFNTLRVTTVSEPSILALLGIGLLGFMRRRKGNEQ